MLPTLSVFGTGRLGQTLARLWADAHYFKLQSIINRSLNSNTAACHFLDLPQDAAYTDITGVGQADIWLIACPDSGFSNAVESLSPIIGPGAVVFHCSGALSSDVLQPLRDRGAHCASIHPLHSFAKPQQSVKHFTGTHCAYEGDNAALATLVPAFEAIGAKTFELAEGKKLSYHAGSVMACNYLTTLINSSYQCFAQAGIDQEQAAALIKPLIEGTLNNIFQDGPGAALTGPIARGDTELVSKQWQALQAMNTPQPAKLYGELGAATVSLAQQQLEQTQPKETPGELAKNLKDLEAIFKAGTTIKADTITKADTEQ